ncbi:CaiB/BaiF CoA transferase family protein [Variovorax sp. M-6]|uniref:CaiB/BaiF CoA transferase family protein n=1 Tax=Variovorax sp. M-6 TaxID=3233041 RepID=UPI003F998100
MALKQGPLAGIRVVEFAGIGPGPMCGMLLADMGAEVLLLERMAPADVGLPRPRRFELVHRGKRSLGVDLKHPDGVALAADLVAAADVLVEGFRPGTMERLGLGPDACMARRPGLVYGRMTGYGQSGPLSQAAGHDLNYIALAGVLHATGRDGQPPTPPLNLVGDYAGGALSLAFGIACALVERRQSGLGQVIDASMVEGAALLMTSFFGLSAAGLHDQPRGRNTLDSGAPFYDAYRCADGEYVAFAAIEPRFRAVFAERAGLPADALAQLDDPRTWPEAKDMLCRLFATRSQRAWCELLEDSDACVTPVLERGSVGAHPHNAARHSFPVQDGIAQPAPAPRLSRTPGALRGPPPARGEGGHATAQAWGIDAARLRQLQSRQIVATAGATGEDD